MLICHCSDWHGHLKGLPEADIYVVTGDMMPDFYDVRFTTPDGKEGIWVPELKQPWPENARWMGRVMDPPTCATKQLEWQQQHPAREGMGLTEDAPVVVVRGNHDFAHLGDWFGGDVWEVTDDPTRTVTMFGKKFGGFRGVNFINSMWSDELYPQDLDERARMLPDDLDVLVTHSPPEGILDVWKHGDNLGNRGLRTYAEARWRMHDQLKLHCFGHIHESRGIKNLGGTIFSNAACTINLVEI